MNRRGFLTGLLGLAATGAVIATAGVSEAEAAPRPLPAAKPEAPVEQVPEVADTPEADADGQYYYYYRRRPRYRRRIIRRRYYRPRRVYYRRPRRVYYRRYYW
jgi:hypothetical protein